jgi:uncharacterized protein YdhG (YjbR/CyaY superfamily)
MENSFITIDDYINSFPKDIQELLEQIRLTIKNAAPEAIETINYKMPTFQFNGNLVHFAAYKQHIGFYPAPSGIEAFKKDLSQYKWAKGSVQFPLDKPIPLDLIAEIVKFRVMENSKKNNRKQTVVKHRKKI